jgi:hypothetical protein
MQRPAQLARLKKFPFNREKFKGLVHYVIWRAGDRDGFGAVKLNKVLWFSDARTFMLRGRPITGAAYIREKYGPVPRPLVPIKNELVKELAIRVWRDRHYDRPATRFHALRAPDHLGTFDAQELETVDWWIEHIDKDHEAGSTSDQSHDYAWEIARMGEELPYHAIFVTRMHVPDDAEMEWARRRSRELSLP